MEKKRKSRQELKLKAQYLIEVLHFSSLERYWMEKFYVELDAGDRINPTYVQILERAMARLNPPKN